jgi:hypothetical protein
MKTLKGLKEYIMKLFSNDPSVSWTRWMGTIIILDVLISWNIACFRSVRIEDVPWGAVTLIITAFTGKVGQAVADRINADPKKPEHPD